jgi:hypothetical protein
MDIQGDVMIQPEEVVPVFDLVANHEKVIAMLNALDATQEVQPNTEEEIEAIEEDFFDIEEEEENEYEEE